MFFPAQIRACYSVATFFTFPHRIEDGKSIFSAFLTRVIKQVFNCPRSIVIVTLLYYVNVFPRGSTRARLVTQEVEYPIIH